MPSLPAVISSRDKVVNSGVRCTLLGVNIFLLLLGMVMMVLCIRVTYHNHLIASSLLPDLWWLGLMPLTVGLGGNIAVIAGHHKWLLLWVVYSTIAGTGGFVLFMMSGSFDTEKFGVTMRIYGMCFQEKHFCECIWAAKTETLSREITCPVIQTTTSIYLSQMILMSLSFLTVIIGCCVASTATCTSCCEEQNEEEHCLLESTLLSKDANSAESRYMYVDDYIGHKELITSTIDDDDQDSIIML